MKNLRAIDLCCGAGGWAVAARDLPIDWVAVVDIAEDCLETWRVNHAERHPRVSSILTDLSTKRGVEAVRESVSGIDLVVGGIPCEKISSARGSTPVSDEDLAEFYRLVDNCLDLVKSLTPRWWCLEDVIQIERHLPLPLWTGEEIPRVRLDASGFGPQSRTRTFLGEFPRPASGHPDTLASCLLPGPHLTFADAERFEVNPTNAHRVGRDYVRILDKAQPCLTITSSFNLRGGRQKRTWVVEDDKGRRRMLSWQEAALVQGFPRDYLFVGGVNRAVGMIGQAIPIQVGRAILEAIAAEAAAAKGGEYNVGTISSV